MTPEQEQDRAALIGEIAVLEIERDNLTSDICKRERLLRQLEAK